jgi:hypothetical protein
VAAAEPKDGNQVRDLSYVSVAAGVIDSVSEEGRGSFCLCDTAGLKGMVCRVGGHLGDMLTVYCSYRVRLSICGVTCNELAGLC